MRAAPMRVAPMRAAPQRMWDCEDVLEVPDSVLVTECTAARFLCCCAVLLAANLVD
jgi:hypothetical protein